MKSNSKNIQWVDGVKAFAILAILLNHFVESFGSGPWFSNPDNSWPVFSVRMANLFPTGGNLGTRLVKFLGWLGDMGPGVFILLSGLTLTISALKKPLRPAEFYRKRLLRIYPLYITIHLLILVVAKFWFKWEIHFFSVPTILSLLGLRFTDSLFFYINPSWWFIWLIIQLYFFFPFLLILLKKKGAGNFLLLTFFATIAFRLAGIAGFSYAHNLYYWMTGLFAGTRLFEFTIGMYAGYLLFNNSSWFNDFLDNKVKIFLLSLLVYALGFVCSWSYAGSLVSNILVTIGMTGIFYTIFMLVSGVFKGLVRPLQWIGRNSFSVFLLHQPFMMYFSAKLDGAMRAAALLAVIIFSFLLGYFLESFVNRGIKEAEARQESISRFLNSRLYKNAILAISVLAMVCSFALMLGFGKYGNLLKLFLFVIVATVLLFRVNSRLEIKTPSAKFFDILFVISSALFLITENWLSTYWLFLLLAVVLLGLTYRIRYLVAVPFIIFLLIGSTAFVEHSLRKNRPVEVLKWGEFPILRPDSETVFSLIPGKTTHLKYNNYDYSVTTNSLGFSSDEVDLSSKAENEKRIMILGDAFSMPEGVPYEESYPFLLEQQLRKAYPSFRINIVNAGVTGYGPNEEYAQLKKYMKLVKPDIILDEFFVNDFDDINVSPAERQASIGFGVDGSFKKKYFGNDQLPLQLNSFAQQKFNLGDKAIQYNKSLLYFYEKDAHYYDDSVIKKLNAYFDNVAGLCARDSTKFIVMYVPGQIEVSRPADISYYPKSENLADTTEFNLDWPQSVLGGLCSKKNIPYINTRPYLKSCDHQPVYFTESWHWNRNGHAAIAQYLFNYLTTNKLL